MKPHTGSTPAKACQAGRGHSNPEMSGQLWAWGLQHMSATITILSAMILSLSLYQTTPNRGVGGTRALAHSIMLYIPIWHWSEDVWGLIARFSFFLNHYLYCVSNKSLKKSCWTFKHMQTYPFIWLKTAAESLICKLFAAFWKRKSLIWTVCAAFWP